jgi:hypothetical protein
MSLEIDELRRRGAIALAAALATGIVARVGELIVPAEGRARKEGE